MLRGRTVTWLVGGGKVQTTEQTQERKNVFEREREKEKEKEKDRERERGRLGTRG